jgi:hypothetical protein
MKITHNVPKSVPFSEVPMGAIFAFINTPDQFLVKLRPFNGPDGKLIYPFLYACLTPSEAVGMMIPTSDPSEQCFLFDAVLSQVNP